MYRMVEVQSIIKFKTPAGLDLIKNEKPNLENMTECVSSPLSQSKTGNIAVFCGASSGKNNQYLNVAVNLGTSIANSSCGLVYGGGKTGLMGAVANAALAAEGKVIGVITEALYNVEVAHEGLNKLEVVKTMHQRKQIMCNNADGFIVLPGGMGTLDELAEICTWNQLGEISKPIVLFDTNYWQGLLQFFNKAQEEGFIKKEHMVIVQTTDSIEEAIIIATGKAPNVPPKN
jgi:uncharacterized protein (TIGR00730 family)